MSKISQSLQDLFLNQLRKEHVSVTIYLTNGFQLRGLIRGFDNFVIMLEVEGKQQMVYKHAMSTICPVKNINIMEESE